MIDRPSYLEKLSNALRRSPVVALLGPRQCGKTTLARIFGMERKSTHFDLESQPDLRRLQNPEMVLGSLEGIVILDEISGCLNSSTSSVSSSIDPIETHGF